MSFILIKQKLLMQSEVATMWQLALPQRVENPSYTMFPFWNLFLQIKKPLLCIFSPLRFVIFLPIVMLAYESIPNKRLLPKINFVQFKNSLDSALSFLQSLVFVMAIPVIQKGLQSNNTREILL